MKKRMIIPMALATSMMMFSCASSNDNMNATAMEDDMSMSSTQTMAGTSDAEGTETLVVEESVVGVVPLATLDVTTLAMENPQEIDEMFEGMSEDETEKYDVLALARTSPNLSTFVKLVEQADLVDDIQRLDKVTLFIPTNEAFAKIPQDKLQMLLMSENKAQLMQVLQAHVLPSEVSSLQLEDNSRIQMSEDTYIPVETGVNGTDIRVGGAQLVKSNIEASNGTIHIIDSVILPSQDTREDTGIGY